jgi:hypothetical protein
VGRVVAEVDGFCLEVVSRSQSFARMSGMARTASRNASRSPFRKSFPRNTTAEIRWVFSMSASGSASSRTRSATLPVAIVPTESAIPSHSAGFRVALSSASVGLMPTESTNSRSSS